VSAVLEETTFYGILVDDWTETPVAWPNREYRPVAGEPWVRAVVLPAQSRQMTLGSTSRRFDYVGVAVVQVFVPAGTGDVEARRLAVIAEDLFRGRTVDDTTFGSPYMNPVGTDGAWYQVNVVIPYRRSSNY
jgi:hypothetical protein